MIPLSAALLPLGAESKLPTPGVTLLPFRPQILTLLVLYGLIHGWLIDRHLAQRSEEEGRVRPWARMLRFVVAGVPLLGQHVVPGWRWILANRRGWVLRGGARFSGLSALSRGDDTDGDAWWRLGSRFRRLADRAIRRLSGQTGLGLLLLLDAVVLLFAVFADTTADPTSEQRLVVAGWGLGFHLLAAAAVAAGFYEEARQAELSRFQVGIHVAPAALWLIPVPYLALGGLFIFLTHWLIADRTPQELTLVHAAHASRGSRLALGRTLEEVMRRGWRGASFLERLRQPGDTFPRAEEPTYVQDRLSWLYRTKSIALAFDALFVGWAAAWLGDRHPAWWPGIEWGLDLAVNVSSGLCLLGALTMAAYFVALAFRTPGPFGVLDEHPYAQFLAAGHLGWLAGLSIGPPLYRGDAAAVAEILKAVGVLGSLGFFAAFLLRIFIPGGERTKRPFQGMLGLLGFLAVGMAGQSMEQEPGYVTGLMSLLTAFAWTFWSWHLLIGVVFLRWLLFPFEWRHLSESGLPGAVRRGLGFLAATTVSPFGGLAIPGWIYLRHRKWPSWRRLVEDDRRSEPPADW